MPKTLILTEKPSVARDIAKALKNCKEKQGYIDCGEYIITWAFGHLFEVDTEAIAGKEWKLDVLPIFPKEFKLKLNKGAGKQFKVIKDLLKKVSKVIIATDSGREGEIIAREILIMAGWKNWDNTYRFWTSEALTPEVVGKTLKNLKPAKEFDSLYYSALARQHADWLVGINLTRLITLKSKDKSVWSVGRVQTPILKLIYERDKEIENFKPEPYYTLTTIFEKDGMKFQASFIKNEKDLEEKKEEEED